MLSRITEPTEGRVVIKGRVASLLEVGTGFHPELTGRENIYLNGAILGMTRAEIRRKFDEIVAFAEVERFLDTPVKRFSSGMYVRLAFAVAAHLEPEILVVDEVLAVGDAEFQRRCLGKMQEVSRGGRTVLFVSHNMAAVKSLTGRCIVLNAGEKRFDGPTEQAIDSYIALGSANRVADVPAVSGKGTHTQIKSVALVDDHGAPISTYMSGSPIRLEIEFMTDGTKSLSVEILLSDHTKAKIGLASLHQFQGRTLPEEAGTFLCKIVLEPMHLAAGMYSFDVTTSNVNDTWDHYVPDALQFEVPFSNPAGGAWNFLQSYGYGALAMPFTSEVTFTELAVCGSPVRQGVGG